MPFWFLRRTVISRLFHSRLELFRGRLAVPRWPAGGCTKTSYFDVLFKLFRSHFGVVGTVHNSMIFNSALCALRGPRKLYAPRLFWSRLTVILESFQGPRRELFFNIFKRLSVRTSCALLVMGACLARRRRAHGVSLCNRKRTQQT